MLKTYLVVISILLAVGIAQAKSTKVIIKEDGKHRLQMTPKMEQALKNAAPTFKQYLPEDYPKDLPEEYKFNSSQMLSAVIGDFNGDGRKDIVIVGADDKGDVTYKIISKGKGYQVSEFWKGRTGGHKDIPKLYHKDGTWAYGMRYFSLRPPGSYYRGVNHKGKDDVCPYDGVLNIVNADGTRGFYFCWRDGDLKWDESSGD